MRKLYLLACLLALATLVDYRDNALVNAQKEPAKKEAAVDPKLDDLIKQSREKQQKIMTGLKFETGVIPIKNGLATIKLPENFRYLNPADAKTVLVDLWGNPPSENQNVLGLIVPADFAKNPSAWAVVITYQADGYVKDDEAEKINYSELLQQMKEGEKEENAEREKQGYDAIELVGWAETPRYEKTTHKLYWARELKVAGYSENTLNYDIRALGRGGVLSLNAIASMDQLQTIKQDMQQVLSFVEFNQGNRYGDYQAGVDKVAAYGIGALVAGKVLAKVGLFKIILGALLAGKKFVILGLAALGAFLKRLFKGKPSEPENEETISA